MSGELRERLIEAGARAIHDTRCACNDWDGLHDDFRAKYLRAAAAVVDALGVEHVAWAVLQEGVTSWRRIEEGAEGGGTKFWRDCESVFRIRAAENPQ